MDGASSKQHFNPEGDAVAAAVAAAAAMEGNTTGNQSEAAAAAVGGYTMGNQSEAAAAAVVGGYTTSNQSEAAAAARGESRIRNRKENGWRKPIFFNHVGWRRLADDDVVSFDPGATGLLVGGPHLHDLRPCHFKEARISFWSYTLNPKHSVVNPVSLTPIPKPQIQSFESKT